MAAEEAGNAAKPELRIGSYRLIEQLGSGGMSSVFRALHADSGHEVAVKVLPRALAKNPTLLQRFLREAKSAESLEHPNIVSIYDRGVDQGRHYLVLEYVPGGDLHERIRDSGPMAIPEALGVIRSVAEGLRFASSRGLVHRDIKPANILVSTSGQVKIIDLGLALQAESEDERVTRDGTTVGTVDYMSPEQARDSRATNERSDMYSLGCTLYFLLTAAPPYPGGNLADKLTRHCTERAPDPRKVRPEIPEPVARIVLRLMAKRPENRFENYDLLISVLDKLLGKSATDGDAALDALIDDEPDDAPLDALVDDDGDAPLEALIDDDDADDRPARGRKKGARPKEDLPSLDSVPLAELAALDEPAAARSGLRPIRTPVATKPATPPPMDALLEEDDDDEPVVAARGSRTGRTYTDASAQTWITRCIVIGVALILFVIGVDQLIKAARQSPSSGTEEEQTQQEPDTDPQPRVSANTPSPPVRPIAQKKGQATSKGQPNSPAVASWVEPSDPAPALIPEEKLAPAVESRFVPSWANAPIPERVDGPLVTVRRLAQPGDAVGLRQAFDKLGGTVVLADNGPLFENDLRLHGSVRLVRAQSGVRPIVAVTSPRYDVVKEQPAVMVLDDKKVTFDGIDFVVKVDELPREQNALFLVRGGSLTLRNCTITVVNPRGQSFSVVRVASARPSQLRLEQTFVRGQGASTFSIAGGPSSIAVSRSVLISGTAPVLAFASNESASGNQVHIARSLLLARAPIFEWSAPPAGQRPKPVAVRALGSTFACFEGATPASLIATRAALEPSDMVQWLGESNNFAGWNALVASGADYEIKIRNLSAVRRAWSGSDANSQEISLAWPELSRVDRIMPADLTSLAPARAATLARVPAPNAYLHEKTISAFEIARVPDPAARAPRTIAGQGGSLLQAGAMMPRPGPVGGPAVPAGSLKPLDVAKAKAAGKAATGTSKSPGKAETAPAADGEFTFYTADRAWSGDVGRFLNAQKLGAVPVVRVHVVGQGSYKWTPVRVPDGVSLEVLVESAGAGGALPTWTATGPSDAEALIHVKGGHLVLSNVVLSRDRSAHPKSLVRVDDGHLVLERCRLLAPGVVDEGGGGLVSFHAPTTRPWSLAPGPFSAAVDRPVCRLIDCILITGGDALTAEVGRGLVALSNCAVASGRSLLSLLPAKVARARFEADLVLDRCTLASERNFVSVGAWKGAEPGPDRPWLIASRATAFVHDYAGSTKDGVLLRADPAAMSHGVIFWQSSNDAYEVPHFAVASNTPPIQNQRPDLQREWVELWEAKHVQRATGVGSRSGNSYRFLNDLQPGHVSPAELVLDPSHHRDRRSLDLGADPKRLGIAR